MVEKEVMANGKMSLGPPRPLSSEEVLRAPRLVMHGPNVLLANGRMRGPGEHPADEDCRGLCGWPACVSKAMAEFARESLRIR